MTQLTNFFNKKPYLIWYVKDKSKISPEVAVEAVLNYGDWDDVQKIIKIVGLKQTFRIFRKNSCHSRSNYRPEIKNYFSLYFNKYAR